MKNPLTPAGIKPATFRFVAQHLNCCATAVPNYMRAAEIKQFRPSGVPVIVAFTCVGRLPAHNNDRGCLPPLSTTLVILALKNYGTCA